ncbi:MAG: hypothetical protein C7B46_02290 [Sulfobacillus benefaciens]|uniref:GGDEF domain-containing protein n=1 Tax=Sulfobacillus benefaciens TaxID=453960 RepID=A0A2T2XKJ9_9FIRM|nr:MAG: hypothetical protein C7B46_02290 [Sulfobacillus benefaciens]
MSAIAETWFLDIIHGVLLAGLLVGIWEWADLVVVGWNQRLSRWVAAIGSPLVLLVLTRWGDFTVPYGIYVLVLLAMWYLFSERRWSFLGSLGVLLAMIVTTVSVHGWSRHTDLDIFLMLLAMGVLARFANYRPVLVYTGTAIVLVTTMMFNSNGVSDLIVTITGAVLLAGYLLGRSRRSLLWALDVDRANHDALTGALTRYGFARWCEKTFHGNIPSGLVIVLDLDDFKSVNDTWGHVAGDDILRQFVQRVSEECREQDALVRSGGDEFIVCIPGTFDESKARSLAERLHHAATVAPYQLSVGPLQLGVSMGYAIGPLSDATTTLADQALLVAKRKGKNQVVQASTNGFAPLEVSHGPLRAELGWLTDAVRGLWAEWP